MDDYRDLYEGKLEQCIRDLRHALDLCADSEEGWPDTKVADIYEASKKIVKPADDGE